MLLLHQINFSQPISNKEKLAIRRETGMVFQDYNLFPHKTVLNNVTEGPTQVLKSSRQQANELAKELLAKVGMDWSSQSLLHMPMGK